MGKVQRAVAPEDLPRFMEVLGEFLGSPEGQAMQHRMDQMIRQFEGFMQSENGRNMEDRLGKLGQMFGGQGEGSKKLKGTVDKLFRPEPARPDNRAPAKKLEKKGERESRKAPADRPAAPHNPRARLY